MNKKIPIVLQGYLASHVGFAEALRNYLFAIDKTGNYKIKVFPYDNDNIKLNLKKFVDTKINERPIWIFHTGPMQMHPTCGYAIGIVVWECMEWPQKFIENFKKLDEIWVPAKFLKDGLERQGLTNVHFIPHPIDTERFNPAKIEPMKEMLDPNLFRFYSVMGWSERKGVSDLLRAYIEEFSTDDDTILYIKANHYSMMKAQTEVDVIRKKIKKKKQPYIVLDTRVYSYDEFPKLYKNADCFVLSSRGEGFGLNYVEAMSMELPTIGTNAFSMPDFMNESNGYLINIKGFKLEPRCDWICDDYKGKKFPIIDIEHLRFQMRKVFENRKEAKQKAKKARKDIIKYCSKEVIGQKLDKRLKEIWTGMKKYKLEANLTKKDSIKYEN